MNRKADESKESKEQVLRKTSKYEKSSKIIFSYKKMFTLEILDLGNIFVAVFITGYLTIEGAVFCTHTRSIYFGGTVGQACWCAGCMTCVVLVFNRCVDFVRPDVHDKLF